MKGHYVHPLLLLWVGLFFRETCAGKDVAWKLHCGVPILGAVVPFCGELCREMGNADGDIEELQTFVEGALAA